MGKKGRGGEKGRQYERIICSRLSEWWTQDQPVPNLDVFWRSHASGGRAKLRGRRGGAVLKGQAGDICAMDPIGEPLISLLTLEIKRGYATSTVAQVLDKSGRAKQQEWEGWLEQVLESASQANSFAWMLLTKRDQREALVFYPDSLQQQLNVVCASIGGHQPSPPGACFFFTWKEQPLKIWCWTLDNWLKATPSKFLRDIAGLRLLQKQALLNSKINHG